MLVARQVAADAKLTERDDVILPSFVRRERSRHAPVKGAGTAEQHDGFVFAVEVLEIHKSVADRDLRNVSNKLFRHTRRLPIDVSICTVRNDLREQNKLGLALTTLHPMVREFGWKLLALMLVISCALLPAVIFQCVAHPDWFPTP